MADNDQKNLHDEINDLPAYSKNITPIIQFISSQTKLLGNDIKNNIYNLYEKECNIR